MTPANDDADGRFPDALHEERDQRPAEEQQDLVPSEQAEREDQHADDCEWQCLERGFPEIPYGLHTTARTTG